MPKKYIANGKAVDKEYMSKLDSISNILRDYQAKLTIDLQKAHPTIDIFGTLQTAASQPNWSNKNIESFANSFIQKNGNNITIKAPEDYVKAAQLYNELSSGKGTTIPQVGQIEDKLENFGIRTAAIKYAHPKGENPYRALSNKESYLVKLRK